MALTLGFYGAARGVTGSRYLLELDGHRVLVDCGLYQERAFQERNWEAFRCPPESLDAVLLTHGHLDHCGLLPKLVREGFRGPIYCTNATRAIARIVLEDAARLQTEDAEYKRKRHARTGHTPPRPVRPLYELPDVETTLPLFQSIAFDREFDVAPGLRATFRTAGHILGAAHVRVTAGTGDTRRSIVFSGDIGRWDIPILHDPTPMPEADYLVIESTYGNREHEPAASVEDALERIVNETRKAGGNIIIPTFAVERAQELLYHLSRLKQAKRIPHLLVVLDSPMAIRVTEVFRKHPSLFDDEMRQSLREGARPFDFPSLQLSHTRAESKAINHIRGSAIILAGSGMCTGGRVKHHLFHNIGRPESTVLFVGYQAVGTLGRLILDGRDPIRILGQSLSVRARIERIHGFSGHADRGELLRWAAGCVPTPRRTFVTHGEAAAADALAAALREEQGHNAHAPEYGETVELA